MQSEVYVLDNPHRRRRHYGHYRRNPDGFVSDVVELGKDASLTWAGYMLGGFASQWFPRMLKANVWLNALSHAGVSLAILSARRMIPGGTRVAVDVANGVALRGVLLALRGSGFHLPGEGYLPAIGGGGRIPFPRVAQRYAMPAPVASPVMPAQKPPVNFR